ncbi:MAG: DUF4133 domain-containing protein [Candidatus Pedobacter colombiensis]|uniref:DUF4133 domain-containing protein n=1 Tax=Candidatus Pedobacter colombiensis TaxID=3121371 RepID=A0AAJ5WBI9_9SPHI|nr:DUF4133 domain-containing protein [Pedobacter sp.]WEK20429.1 MAG: DUF4133 domain-containing protein [Pedobacter sp.]
MASVYQINKGVGRPVVFKGLKAQYIAFLAVGMVLLLLGFVGGYLSGLSLYVLLPLALMVGSGLVYVLTRLSHKFGEHGLMKLFAKYGLPSAVVFRSRRVFTGLKYVSRNDAKATGP